MELGKWRGQTRYLKVHNDLFVEHAGMQGTKALNSPWRHAWTRYICMWPTLSCWQLTQGLWWCRHSVADDISQHLSSPFPGSPSLWYPLSSWYDTPCSTSHVSYNCFQFLISAQVVCILVACRLAFGQLDIYSWLTGAPVCLNGQKLRYWPRLS